MAFEEPAKRVRRWMEERGLNQSTAAEVFGCTPGFVSKMLAGRRSPGRRVANAIELATLDWSEGPVRALEWDLAEDRAGSAELSRTGTEG